MELGEVIEYIEHRKILCAVILKKDKKKLKVLAESGREIKLSIERISHKSKIRFDLSAGRTQLLTSIKQISTKRNTIANTIDVKALWCQLNKNQTWIGVKSLAKLCFLQQTNDNEEAAIIRALFKNKLYFKFKPVLFSPNSRGKIDELNLEIKRSKHQQKLIQAGVEWIKDVKSNSYSDNSVNENSEFKNILSSFYIFGKTSPSYSIANTILTIAGIKSKKELFNFMSKIKVWDIHENIDILRFKIPIKFTHAVMDKAKKLENDFHREVNSRQRIDFTDKFTITIDGTDTLDFDDALTIEQRNNNFLIGIHISDIAHYVKRRDLIDSAAYDRITSIYMPDLKIPMIPPNLSENICSLKKGEVRPAISTVVKLNSEGSVIDYSVCPSTIRVDKQLSYPDADKAIQYCEKIRVLHDVAKKLRKIRINNGATQITLPELNIKLREKKNFEPVIKKIDRESPSRMLIEEMMILSNWLNARFLKKHKVPAIFRSQPEPRARILKGHSNSLFHNWMQKKMLRKLSLTKHAKHHCILGLDAYVTASSPIRKYSDLITQRQIRGAIKIGRSYANDEINAIIQKLASNTACISKMQFARKRYWLLKHLEKKIGQKEDAIILQKRQGSYNILIKAYMIECFLPQSSSIRLEPKDLVRVTIQHVNARNNTISVFMG